MARPIVKIGFQVPSEDVYAVTGYCAAEMAIEEANSASDFPYEVRLEPIVDSRDYATARAAASRFVNDSKAFGVLGPLNSEMAVATQDLYNHGELAQLTSEASSPLLTRGGYQNFFRLVANDSFQGRALANVAVHVTKSQRIAVLHDDSAWGRPISEIFSAEVRAKGIEPVLIYGFGEVERDLHFDSLVDAVASANPDLVYFAVYWNKAHIIAHKLRYLGIQAIFLGSDALKPYAFLEVPSLDIEPPYHTLAGIDMRLKPSARTFLKAFASRHPTMLASPQYAAEAYDCATLLLTALRRASGLDRARVIDELRALAPFEGAIGSILFDDAGDLINPEIGLYRCKDGQRVYMGSVDQVVTEASK